MNQFNVGVQVGQNADGQFSCQHVMATKGSQCVTEAVLCDEGADIDDMLCRENAERTAEATV